MSGEWLSRNPTSRKRSSYDSDWGTYEARAGGGGRSSWRGSGALNRNNIIAEGQRVGIPHDNNHNNSRQQHQPPPPPRQHQYSSRNTNNQQNNGQAPSRSIRVADYRGAAARVGTLPFENPYNKQHSQGGGRGGYNNNDRNTVSSNNNDYDVSLFQNEDFLKSLLNPPPITVKLPSDLRSTLNEEQ